MQFIFSHAKLQCHVKREFDAEGPASQGKLTELLTVCKLQTLSIGEFYVVQKTCSKDLDDLK